MEPKLTHSANRKWFSRAVAYLKILKREGPEAAKAFRMKFRNSSAFTQALEAIQAGIAAVSR